MRPVDQPGEYRACGQGRFDRAVMFEQREARQPGVARPGNRTFKHLDYSFVLPDWKHDSSKVVFPARLHCYPCDGLMLYDPKTGGCRDGLHVDRVNQNQGAESTLAFLLALEEMQRLQNAMVTVAGVSNPPQPMWPAHAAERLAQAASAR